MGDLREDLDAAIAKQPPFMDRVNNPQNYPVRHNEGGGVSTHRMAAEVDENGKWHVFPTIIPDKDGNLMQFDNNHEAMRHNLQSGNVMSFDAKDEALNFAEGGYKTPEFLEYVRQQGQPK
jgi:hypothetical protein